MAFRTVNYRHSRNRGSECQSRRKSPSESLGQDGIIDIPPGLEGLVRTALELADVVIIPTRVGGVEVARAQKTIAMISDDVRYGLVIVSSKPQTRDYRESVSAWAEVGAKVLGVVPERVAIAAGPDADLFDSGMEDYELIC